MFAPMNKIKREATGRFYRVLDAASKSLVGEVGEEVTYHSWGGVTLRFSDGAMVVFPLGDIVEIVPEPVKKKEQGNDH